MKLEKRTWNCAEIITSGSEADPNSIQVQVGRNSDNIYLKHSQDVTHETFQGDITITRDARGVIIGLICDIISPMPSIDPDEPIPYRLTEKGKRELETYRETHENTFDGIFPTIK